MAGVESWTLLSFAVTLTMWCIQVAGQVNTKTETSAEYLQNVMSHLQELNKPSSMNADRTTGFGVETSYFDSEKQNYALQKNLLNEWQNAHQSNNYYSSIDTKNTQTILNDINADQTYLESNSHYYQVPPPQTIPEYSKVRELEPLGLTRTELASLYKNGLENGSPVSLSSLTSALSSGKIPQVTTTHLELPARHPGYYYYFYPLKSFMAELQNNHGYKTIPNVPANTEESEKQMANPLFLAITGFIGMALLFMMGVLFLPKFGGFKSREVHHEFLQLTKIAAEAIDGRNCFEKFDCNLKKSASNFNMRFLKAVLPTTFRKQGVRIRKYSKMHRN